MNPEQNKRYQSAEDLHPLTWQALQRRPEEEVVEAAGTRWLGQAHQLLILGRELSIWPSQRRIAFVRAAEEPVGYQRALIAVTYLAQAMAIDPRGDWVTPRELPGGDAFFRGPHSVNTALLEQVFGARPEQLLTAAARVGGLPGAGGDVAITVTALPKIPLRVLLWAGTDEFAPRANVLIDPRAYLHMPLDALWALTNLLIEELTKEIA